MGCNSRAINEAARIPFRQYSTLHLGPVLGQGQPAPSISTDFPSAVDSPRGMGHHCLCLHVERGTNHTRHVRLRSVLNTAA